MASPMRLQSSRLHGASWRFWQSLALLVFVCLCLPVYAGRPMIVEDATILAPNACQLESWMQDSRGSTEYWAVPACNFTGNLELALGGARLADDAGHTTVSTIQGKSILRALQKNGWGTAIVIDAERRTSGNTGAIDNLYGSGIVSFSFSDDRTLIHTNLGARRSLDEHRTYLTWGIGQETKLSERISMTAEIFGEQRGKRFYQFGARYAVVPEKVQVDASYGNRFPSRSYQQWISVGLVLFLDSL